MYNRFNTVGSPHKVYEDIFLDANDPFKKFHTLLGHGYSPINDRLHSYLCSGQSSVQLHDST